jgi:hypothetical protein
MYSLKDGFKMEEHNLQIKDLPVMDKWYKINDVETEAQTFLFLLNLELKLV